MRLFVLVFFLLISFLSASAKDRIEIAPQPGWLYSVKPDFSKKPDLRNVSSGYYLELLDRQINVIVQTEYVHFIRHIINETGVQNASEVSVTFSPGYQKVVFHKIVVIRNGTDIDQLSAGNIKVVQEETDVNDFQYNGTKRAFIILKDVRKNDRIEVAYSLTGFNPVFGNLFSTELYFSNSNPISNYFETIIAEDRRKLFFTPFESAPLPKEETIQNTRVYHWNNPTVKLWEKDAETPSWFNSYPYITITEYTSWKEVADWGTDLFNNYKYDLPPGLIRRINEWKKMADGNENKFTQQAIRYVQDEIRYLGLEIGVHTHKPHSPADVFKSGYGDCKDKSLLLATILQHENIPAYVALINTGKKTEMFRSAPAPKEFNHAIVAIEKQRGLRYVDPTYSFQRGELSDLYVPPYGYALLLRKAETGLRAVPVSDVSSTVIVENLDVRFDDTSRMSVFTTSRGGFADNMRSSFSDISMKYMRDNYLSYYASTFEGIQMNEDIWFEDDSALNSFAVKEEYVIPALWKKEEKKKTSFDVYAKAVHLELTTPPEGVGKTPVALKFPSSVRYTLNIDMPENWDFPKKEVHIKNDSYQFDFESEVKGKLITLKYFIKTFKDHVPAAEVEQYRKDYKTITDVIEYNLFYNKDLNDTDQEKDSVNWITVLIGLLTTTGLILVFKRLNRRVVEVQFVRDGGWKIAGWMVVLGGTIALAVGMHAYTLFTSEYFSHNSWKVWQSQGSGLLTIIVAELFFSIVGFCSASALLYWFIKRRDIFPQMFYWYVGLLIGAQISLTVMYSAIPIPSAYGNLSSAALTNVFRGLVYAAIWCTYVARSYRAKATFLKGPDGYSKPYHSNTSEDGLDEH